MKSIRKLTLILFLLGSKHLFAQSPKSPIQINIDYDIHSIHKKEYAEIRIKYKNVKSSPAYLWIQNWRLILLDEETDRFDYFPSGDIRTNAVAVLANRIDVWNIEKPNSDIDYLDTLINCSFIKKLQPSQTFQVSITVHDSALISTLRKPESEFFAFYTYTNAPIKNEKGHMVNEKSNLFFNENILSILYFGRPEDGSENAPLDFNVTSKKAVVSKAEVLTLDTKGFKTVAVSGKFNR